TLLHDLFPRSTVAAVPDFEAALVACGPGIDVCVLAGTGSFVCSFGPDGIVHRSGGKGHLLGDEGSAFQYGREALQHFLEAPPDDVSETLRLSVLEGFGSMRKPEVTAALHAVPDPARLLASLAPAFAADAEAEAVYALRALRIHPGKLAHQVSMHLRQHHPNLIRPRIGCQGGLWRHAIYRDAFAQQLGFWCRAEELEAEFDLPAPVHGAAEIAGRLI
ncbi:MAG: hypothetical protein IH851_00695, partial [Armatimonadetes bacterium]|nr:hypothetical protein [Armatimonadota bacterium]